MSRNGALKKVIKLNDSPSIKEDESMSTSPPSPNRMTAIAIMAAIALITFVFAVRSGFWISNAAGLLALLGFLLVVLVELSICFRRGQAFYLSVIVPLLFQLAFVAPLLLISSGWGLDFPDYNYWLWPFWVGCLFAAILFYFLIGPRGIITKYRRQKNTKMHAKGARQVIFALSNLVVLGLLVYGTVLWGSIALASFPLLPEVAVDNHASLSSDQGHSVSTENDYEALEVIAGAYVEVEYFSLQEDGALRPITRLFDSVYIFNQDGTYEIFQDELLLEAGSFIISNITDDVSQATQLNQQVLEDFADLSGSGLYQIDMSSEDGMFAGFQQTRFILRTGDGRTMIHDPVSEGIAVVEEFQ